MATIAAKIVKRPWSPKTCEQCGKRMPLYRPRMRLYGSACGYDRPYAIYICMECAGRIAYQRQVKAAMEAAS